MEGAEHHEVEIFKGRGLHEGAESQYKWKNCTKNPGHIKFISAQDFKDSYLPKIQHETHRKALRSCIDLTVRLRVNYTSTERPDDDGVSLCRGTSMRRMGTGFIDDVDPPEPDTSSNCIYCVGEVQRRHWRFWVHTAKHVVYDTDEAKKTNVDLFLDDESCEKDGRMKSVEGVEVLFCTPDTDRCLMSFLTCDEELGEWLESTYRSYRYDRLRDLDLSGLDLLPSSDKDSRTVLIVSHPHGQPKRITVGEVKENNSFNITYTVPTCPGSSGAPVFKLKSNAATDTLGRNILFSRPVHSGSYNEESTDHEQLNFGFFT